MADKTKYFDYETVKEMLYDLEYEGKDVDPNDYPFIEIADEHGDLIDRDAVLNELKKYYKVGEIAEVGEVACFISDAEVVLERRT